MADGLWFAPSGRDGALRRDVYRFNDGPWQTGSTDIYSAFRISGQLDAAPVPEPGTVILLATGVALAGLRRRRRLRG